jgi:hypothetical protein
VKIPPRPSNLVSALTIQFFKTVGRHFVSLSCVQHPPAKAPKRVFVFSGFLIEAGGLWFYITAGHILRDIRESLDLGGKFEIWRLDDQTAGNRFAGAAIPFEFDLDSWIVVENSEIGLDYAALALHPFYVRQLQAGGAIPIGRDAWGDHIAEHDDWALVGIPSETVKYESETTISGGVVVMPLEPTEEPEAAGSTSENKFFARIKDLGSVTDVDGMSGGPVFSLKKNEGRWRYKVIGVQSSWYPKSSIIAACPIASLGTELERLVETANRMMKPAFESKSDG